MKRETRIPRIFVWNQQGIKHDAPNRKKRRERRYQLASVLLLHPTRRFSNGRMLMRRLHLDSEHRLITGWASQKYTSHGFRAFRLHVGTRVRKMSGGAGGWSASYAWSVASVFKWAGGSSLSCLDLKSRASPPPTVLRFPESIST